MKKCGYVKDGSRPCYLLKGHKGGHQFPPPVKAPPRPERYRFW